ncbi:UNVERIFIED_CONTAM: hypothetical protein K2H54_055111 [Gekko kuhli]
MGDEVLACPPAVATVEVLAQTATMAPEEVWGRDAPDEGGLLGCPVAPAIPALARLDTEDVRAQSPAAEEALGCPAPAAAHTQGWQAAVAREAFAQLALAEEALGRPAPAQIWGQPVTAAGPLYGPTTGFAP